MKYLNLNHVMISLVIIIVIVVIVKVEQVDSTGRDETTLTRLNELVSLVERASAVSVHEQCKINIKLNKLNTVHQIQTQLKQFCLNKNEMIYLINSTQNEQLLDMSAKLVKQCTQLNLTLTEITHQTDDTSTKNDIWQFLSSKSKIIVYFLFIIVLFMLCCVFVYWMAVNRGLNKKNKKKRQKSNQYFNPFDIIKMNDFNSKNKTNHNINDNNNNNNTNSSTALLQPSTLDLNESSRLDNDIDNELVEPEGDTRSEYSITDMERMKYVKQWIENLS